MESIFVTLTAIPNPADYDGLPAIERVERMGRFFQPLVDALIQALADYPVTVTRLQVIGGVIVHGDPTVLAALQVPGALLSPHQTRYKVADDIQFYPTKP